MGYSAAFNSLLNLKHNSWSAVGELLSSPRASIQLLSRRAGKGLCFIFQLWLWMFNWGRQAHNDSSSCSLPWARKRLFRDRVLLGTKENILVKAALKRLAAPHRLCKKPQENTHVACSFGRRRKGCAPGMKCWITLSQEHSPLQPACRVCADGASNC